MNILVTGAGGFLGKNLIAGLKAQYGEVHRIITYDKANTFDELESYTRDCDFVYHFAAVHRPVEESSFKEVNLDLFCTMLEYLRTNGNKCPVLYTSTIQAVQNTAYARSKRMAEEALREHETKNGSRGIIYRLTNTFGKWAKPNAYSVVATFCFRIARRQEIKITNPAAIMNLYYIDDVINAFISHLKAEPTPADTGYYSLPEEAEYHITVQELADIIRGFQRARESLYLPELRSTFVKRLYSTYLSYLPMEELILPLTAHTDARGSFTEVFRTNTQGQFSINITKPGIRKGDHYHNCKCERFYVLAGKAKIQLRKIGSDEVTDYVLTSETPQLIEIPPGYTHNLINIGDTDLYTLIWANEVFDQQYPDTYSCQVPL